MNASKAVLNLLVWALIVLLQASAGILMVFIFSFLSELGGLAVSTHSGWALSVVFIWLGFTLGTGGVGWLAVRLLRREQKTARPWNRKQADAEVPPSIWMDNRVFLLIPALLGLIPTVVLLVIGLQADITNQPAFQSAIFESWQPRLSQLTLLLGLIGFYVALVMRTLRKSEV